MDLQMVPRFTIPEAAANSGGMPEGAARACSIKVWLVDDSENFRTLLGALLEEEGGLQCPRQFSTAEDVIAALENEVPPDVILLDIRMPGMGGVAAVRPIKTLAPSTRVLMLTTFFDSQAKSEALRDGAADLLLKSLHLEEITQRIRDVHEHPEQFPKADADSPPDTGSITLDWPDTRASEVKHGRFNNPEGGPQPETGLRNESGKRDSSRLARGVNFLRSLVQTIGKPGAGKSSEAPLGAGNPGQ
jgi:CheY-like chemotaxis protein